MNIYIDKIFEFRFYILNQILIGITHFTSLVTYFARRGATLVECLE